MHKSYKSQSIISSYIDDFIMEKRSMGYSYKTSEKILYNFDYYCFKNNLSSTVIKRDFLDEWLTQSDTESLSYKARRISSVRVFLQYMASLGHDVYIPHDFSTSEKRAPHILCDEEVTAFFHVVDNYKPSSKRYYRLANEYKVLFRMIITCGLRNSEASCLPLKNVDFKSGKITILNSKGKKDRLVYMADDFACLCIEYYEYLVKNLKRVPEWLFPALNYTEPLSPECVDAKFNEFWRKTSYAKCCNNKPTVQDLRHTFVTKRINKWIEDGIDIGVMLPYLSKFLGHKSSKDTYYYYHLAKDAFRIIKARDTTTNQVIPEVTSCEKE